MVELNVNGKIALVTGGTRGLGLSCAEGLVENGASTVIITSRKEQACKDAKEKHETLAKSRNSDCKIIAFPAELSEEKQCAEFCEKVTNQIDRLDILIANAGATWGAPLEEHSVSALKKVLNLNIVAVFQVIQLLTPLLEKAGTADDPARIVIMSSIIALVANDPVGIYGYLASKSGVSHLGRNLAVQLGPRNITVNSLAPGFVPTKMSKGLIDISGDLLVETNPRRRLGENEDIKNAMLFVCSKQANYVNGVVLPIDGGAHLVSAGRL